MREEEEEEEEAKDRKSKHDGVRVRIENLKRKREKMWRRGE